MSRTIRERLLASTLIAGAAFTFMSAPAFAQSTPPATTPAAGTDSSTSGDKSNPTADVVVTGSRIKRNAFTAPDPITVITADQATLAGYADTASLLQQSSIAAGSFQTNDQLTGFVVTGGPGSKTLNLRRLGANRTIILLDGKRLGPAGVGGTVGPVDLNVISQSSVAKIEVLKDGASSIYGSDAVAGVVNIITKKNHDGGELSAYTSQGEQQGGAAYTLSGDWGKTFDKGYVEIAGEYYEQDRLARGQRDYLNCSEDYLFNPTTGARVDFGAAGPNYGHQYKCYNSVNNVINTAQYSYVQYLQPGLTYPTNSVDPAVGGNNVTANPAVNLGGGPLNSYVARQARAGFPLTYPYANYYTPLTDRASAISPDRHYNFSGNAGYDFNATTHLYGQFQYSERVSRQTGARQYFPGSGAAGSTLSSAFAATNPNNVFAGTGITPNYGVVELPSDYEQDVKYYRGVIGLKGDFTNVGWFNRFSYDVSGVYSRSSANYTFDAIYNDRSMAITQGAPCTTAGITNYSSYSCSMIPASGIPILSSRFISGNFTQQERDFLFFKTHGATDYDQYILEAGITGDLFNLPAGAVGGAFGVSYRHDKLNDTPDQQVQLGNTWGQTAAGHTAGTDSVKEVYGEITVPVIKNVPFIQNLNFDISGRYSDYKSYGSTSTYKVSGSWTVIPDLRFRASVGTSFRAPALYELYLAHQTGFLGQGSVDPCINYGSASGLDPRIPTACAALGIGPTYTGAGSSATISTGGGIGNLQAETSQAKSLGVVITPKHFGIDRWSNLSIALDYFQFAVHNEVSTFGAYGIISQCLEGNSAFCSLFTRDSNPASGTYQNILTVNNNYVNVASQSVRGLDATIHADHNFGKWGRLALDSNMTWTFADKNLLLGGSPIQDYNGATFNYDGPDFSGNAQLQWDYKDWTVFWNTQVIGKGSDTEVRGFDTTTNSRYGVATPAGVYTSAQYPLTHYKFFAEFTAYHDVSVRKRFPAMNVELIGGVKNVFDEQPPAGSTADFRLGTAQLNAYDLIGRQYFLRVTKKW